MKNTLKILCLVLILCLATSSMAFAASTVKAQTFKNLIIDIDGKDLALFDDKDNMVEAIVYDGTTYLPVQVLIYALGKGYKYDPKTTTIDINDSYTVPDVIHYWSLNEKGERTLRLNGIDFYAGHTRENYSVSIGSSTGKNTANPELGSSHSNSSYGYSYSESNGSDFGFVAEKDIQIKFNPSLKIKYNGKTQTLKDSWGKQATAILYKDRNYLPLKCFTQIFGGSLNYDAETQTAYISTKK